MMMDKIGKIAQEKSTWSMGELGCMADIMKDMATTEKAIAKAHYYHTEHSEEVY